MAKKSDEEKNKDEGKPGTDKDLPAGNKNKKTESPDDCHLGLSVPPDEDPPDSK